MTTRKKPLALVDLDGTLADFDGAMQRDLRKLLGPGEELLADQIYEDTYPYIKARRDLVKAQPEWWFKLERLENGFRIVDHLRTLGFRLNILTRGPKKNFSAWEQKARWSFTHVPDAKMTITTGEKAGNYGRVLVDDWPPYLLPWLKVRPRGLVVMPAQRWNDGIEHERILRYRGPEDDARLLELLKDQRARD